MARPMIKEAGMASLLLENPYYILETAQCVCLEDLNNFFSFLDSEFHMDTENLKTRSEW